MGQLAACIIIQSGNIECTITGTRRCPSDSLQGRLEVPCTMRFHGDAKVRKILQT